ncbi:GNAT family N-acetyltransferase [Paenibacillus glycanilyticus]|uniref:GNAT family N-acetyltransferase n=1 Tax=Paenibacillus glycanilyticus TaxID=126569 RepID=UPI003EB840BC
MNYRKAEIEDIEALMSLRKQQLIDEGIAPDQDIDEELRTFFANKLTDGSLMEWVVEADSEIVATAAVIFYDFPPSFTNKSGKKAYITNMYTDIRYRGHGIATQLLNRLVEEVKSAGVQTVWLAASQLGKPVYKKFGFQEANDWMEMHLKED